jgi:tetratricopeptide (TPR) repeat protein
MKKHFFKLLIISILLIYCNSLSAQFKLPSTSPKQVIRQNFGQGYLELTYSRPSTKGRKVFGGLESYGKIWRTGANEATLIKLTMPTEIGKQRLDSGTYALYTIPNPDKWTIIFNKGIKNWGAQGYKSTDDVLKFDVIPIKTKEKVETLTFQFNNLQNESCDLEIKWEKTLIRFSIHTFVKEELRKEIEKGLADGSLHPWTAAEFYFHWDNNFTKALEYTDKAIILAEEKNRKVPWMYLLKAKCLKNLGKTQEAKINAEKCVVLAKETNFENYINQGKDLLKELK